MTYTGRQIKEGCYNFQDIFGFVGASPLPWRAVGFHETSTDGIFEGTCMCQESLEDLVGSIGWFDYKLYAIYHFDGANWIKQPSEGRL